MRFAIGDSQPQLFHIRLLNRDRLLVRYTSDPHAVEFADEAKTQVHRLSNPGTGLLVSPDVYIRICNQQILTRAFDRASSATIVRLFYIGGYTATENYACMWTRMSMKCTS